MEKAVVVHRVGGPDVLSYEDHPIGAPGPGEVALRQTAIGVNFVDTYQRSGLYKVPTPFVAGNEAAGIVTAVGDGVTLFKLGDRVAYSGGPGAYASGRLYPAQRLVPVPDGIPDDVAAAIVLKGMTAYFMLFETYKVVPGSTLLFHAAAGGVGLIATQWARALGATVIGTVGGPEKVAIAAEHCDHVIDYQNEDFVARVREITGGKGVDVVYDGVGKATFEKSLDCLRPRGLFVHLGSASGTVEVHDLAILGDKGSIYVTKPSGNTYLATREELLRASSALFDAVLSGHVEPRIHSRFALADAGKAHRALEERRTAGSVILLP